MITNEWIAGKDDISIPLGIRKTVFGESGAEDRDDAYAMHLCVYTDDVCIAAGRLFVGSDNKFHISHICVLEGYRGQGIGDLTAKLLLFKAFQSAQELRAEIPCSLESFFARYGFKVDASNGETESILLNKEDVVYPSKCSKEAGNI